MVRAFFRTERERIKKFWEEQETTFTESNPLDEPFISSALLVEKKENEKASLLIIGS